MFIKEVLNMKPVWTTVLFETLNAGDQDLRVDI